MLTVVSTVVVIGMVWWWLWSVCGFCDGADGYCDGDDEVGG